MNIKNIYDITDMYKASKKRLPRVLDIDSSLPKEQNLAIAKTEESFNICSLLQNYIHLKLQQLLFF